MRNFIPVFYPSDVKINSGYFPNDVLPEDRHTMVAILLRFLIRKGDNWCFSKEDFLSDASKLMEADMMLYINVEQFFASLIVSDILEECEGETLQPTDNFLWMIKGFLKNEEDREVKDFHPSDVDLSTNLLGSDMGWFEYEELAASLVRYLQQNGNVWTFKVREYIENTLKTGENLPEFSIHSKKVRLHPKEIIKKLEVFGLIEPSCMYEGYHEASQWFLGILQGYLKKETT
jgi:hypothetical protein